MTQESIDVIEQIVEGEGIDALFELVSGELILMVTALLAIGIFGSLAIYSRGWAVPAVVAILTVPAVATVLPSIVGQIITQAILLILIGLLFTVFKRRL